jgi:hypothetical protein
MIERVVVQGYRRFDRLEHALARNEIIVGGVSSRGQEGRLAG